MAARRRTQRRRRDVKDRLIQTRVPERLKNVLEEEAAKRRLTVSHLIRNLLEDTLSIVDTVAAGAGSLVEGSRGFAEQVARDAGRIASSVRQVVKPRSVPPADAETADRKPDGAEPAADAGAGSPRAPSGLDHVLAWNQVVVNRPSPCAGCGTELAKGSVAHLGLAQDPSAPPTWLCPACLARL
jgi:hypothetical protein